MFSPLVGQWVLVPEENKFESGLAPLEGRYTISVVESQTLRFDLTWKDVNGAQKSESYVGHPWLNKFKPRWFFETKTYKNGGVILHEIRELTDAGKRKP
ncbi:MAG TPA: hypothetical protein DCY20_00765 [Firmicutes bacterium]|nr:hypothetical protein [Bacillota bacterium]